MVEGLTFFSTDQGSVTDPGASGARYGVRQQMNSQIEVFNWRSERARGSAIERSRFTIHATNPGDTGGEATPVPIPNTEVKLSSAEDTERAAFRENRSSPGFLRSSCILPLARAVSWLKALRILN